MHPHLTSTGVAIMAAVHSLSMHPHLASTGLAIMAVALEYARGRESAFTSCEHRDCDHGSGLKA